ncbi:MAG: hypothetical protein QF681_08665 [Vicinamibacterales bacterium]|jgi:hypothetical protein|nr:hypothetical protein [Vicinamibacterales bacterium]
MTNIDAKLPIGIGLVLVGAAVGVFAGDPLLIAPLGWIGFALVIPGSVLIRIVGGFILTGVLLSLFVQSTDAPPRTSPTAPAAGGTTATEQPVR